MNQTIKERQVANVRAAIRALALITASAAATVNAGYGQTVTTLVQFDPTINAGIPYSRLIADANGNLFGTTLVGGVSSSGTVFEIMKTSNGYAGLPTILFSFDGPHGAYPAAGLVADASGNLFGTTTQGGAFGQGTVFEIAKTATGYASTPTVLVSFDGIQGRSPQAALILDANGNLFGTTAYGGRSQEGTVFEVLKTPAGYANTPTVLVNLGGTAGTAPVAVLLADEKGNLIGTTTTGGTLGFGTVFQVVKTSTGYSGTPTVITNFDQVHGAYPAAGVIADRAGNLFGTTALGGAANKGTLFEIARTTSGYASTPTVLVTFDGSNGSSPTGDLLADATGSLFGTTTGITGGLGAVFELMKTAGGYDSAVRILHKFPLTDDEDVHSTDGAVPQAGLIADRFGNLFGTTRAGGYRNQGTVFELSGSGFIPPVMFSGVPGSANCKGASSASLAQTYGGMSAAAGALGYGSVVDLQTAIAGYCGR